MKKISKDNLEELPHPVQTKGFSLASVFYSNLLDASGNPTSCYNKPALLLYSSYCIQLGLPVV